MSRIVLVDDEEEILAMLKDYLEFKGHSVKTASRGSEGLRLILQTPPDLAILDLRMPEITGLEVLKQIKLSQPQIRVVILTGQLDEESEAEALDLGASLCLHKPLALEELDRAISGILPPL